MPPRRLPDKPPVEAAALPNCVPDAAALRPTRREPVVSRGLAVSLLLHSLPLLALIGWRAAPQDVPKKAVPVEFVLQQPKPAAAKPPPPSLPIRGASADTAETAAPKPVPGIDRAAHDAAAATPAEPRVAKAEPRPQAAPEPPGPKLVAPPKPEPRADQPQPEELPRSRDGENALPPPSPPKPAERKREPSAPVRIASSWPLPLPHQRAQPNPPRHLAALVGPPAIRDEYCVRALAMTLAHRALVSAAFLNGRHGKAVLSIRILGDGTLNSVKIRQSSGYPDIDQKIAQMVFAVGIYPPLPPSLPGSWMDFTFMLVFPDGLER